jgi:hypothetical protein
MHHRAITVLFLLLALPLPARAQQATYTDYQSDVAPALAPISAYAAVQPRAEARRASFEAVTFGALLGWGAGLAAGGLAGYALKPRSSGDAHFGEAEWWIGAWIGSSLGAALGAHLTNSGRGNLLLSSLGALASVPALAIIAAGLPGLDGAPLLALPAAPILTSVIIERGTASSEN